ncbi:HD-GYP domain-containing protein [Oleidesulfovibrio sp.]|uniref:HD-GYP domain-containing protein n=1 Tax=Oleidesulfovibrio sp. TaxID=2909707 RepID=UPI003A864FB0
MLLPDCSTQFSVFLRQDNKFVLYTNANEAFTHKHKKRLTDNGISEVWLQQSHKPEYTAHVESHLGSILKDDSLPIDSRAGALYGIAADFLRDAFEGTIPDAGEIIVRRMELVVAHALELLKTQHGIKALGKFISHDYRTWTHCLNTMLYTLGMLQNHNLTEEALAEIGMGALLHDIGKTKIPLAILQKTESLTKSELEYIKTHPLMGVACLPQQNLPQAAINCILFHHEKLNGTGYPTGLAGEEIPFAVRAVTIADIYDALTSNRPYAKGRPPFAVLQLMRSEMAEELDMQLFKDFVLLLSNAGMTASR